MRRVIVRYQVKPGRAEENETFVRAVFAQLKAEAPEGMRYATFRAADGVTFFHLASFERDDDSNPLGALPAFKAFQQDLKERCAEPPNPTEVTLVESYRFFD